MKTIEYINILKKQYDITSAYGLGKLLGVTNQTALNWVNKKSTFDDKTAVKVALLLRMPPEIVLAEMHGQRTKCSDAKICFEHMAAIYRAMLEDC